MAVCLDTPARYFRNLSESEQAQESAFSMSAQLNTERQLVRPTWKKRRHKAGEVGFISVSNQQSFRQCEQLGSQFTNVVDCDGLWGTGGTRQYLV